MFAFIPISSHHRGAPTYRTNDVFTALARQSLGPQSIEGYLFGGAVTRYLGRRTPAHRGVFCDHDHAAQHRHYGFPPFHRADNGLGGMFSGPIPHADETAALFFNEVAQQSERRAREQTRARAAEAAGLRNPEYSETFELLRPLYGEECGKAANNHPGASIGLNPRHQDEDLNEHELLRLVDEEKQQVLALEEEVRRVTSENERAHSVEQLIQEYITNFALVARSDRAEPSPAMSRPNQPNAAYRQPAQNAPQPTIPSPNATVAASPPSSSSALTYTRVDKGKGKGKATPPEITPSAADGITLDDLMAGRLMTETDPEIRDTLHALMASLLPVAPQPSAPSVPAFRKDPSLSSSGRSSSSTEAGPSRKVVGFTVEDESEDLRRASLDSLRTLASSFATLQSGFTFPSALDFTPLLASPISPEKLEMALPYTPANAPLHAHEAALGQLLLRLDAIESGGDEMVRKQRKVLVRQVERALEEMDAMVAARKAEVDVGKNEVKVDAEVADNKNAAEDTVEVPQPVVEVGMPAGSATNTKEAEVQGCDAVPISVGIPPRDASLLDAGIDDATPASVAVAIPVDGKAAQVVPEQLVSAALHAAHAKEGSASSRIPGDVAIGSVSRDDAYVDSVRTQEASAVGTDVGVDPLGIGSEVSSVLSFDSDEGAGLVEAKHEAGDEWSDVNASA